MARETVFITGSTGFIGFVVLRKLLESGYKVRALVRKQEGADNLRKHLLKHSESLQPVVSSGSFEDPKTFDGLLKGVTHVVHLVLPIPSKLTDYLEDIINPAVNVNLNLLKAASKEPSVKRVVITSSVLTLADFGAKTTATTLDESDWGSYQLESASNSAYSSTFEAFSAAKTIAEKEAWKFQKENNPSFDIVTILPSFVVGRNELADKGEFVGQTNSVPFRLITEGSTRSPPVSLQVHVLDVADAHVRALDPKIPGNERFIVTSGEGKWNDAIDAAKEYKPDYSWDFGSYEDIVFSVTNAKAVKVLGISFRTYKQAIKDMLAGYFGDPQ